MLPLAGWLESLVRATLRSLPLSDYQKTRLWATSLRRPQGRVQDWAYYRCIELALRALSSPDWDRFSLPGAGHPTNKYSMLEFGVANGHSFQLLLHFRDVWQQRLGLKNQIVALGFDTFEGLPEAGPGDSGLVYRVKDFSDVDLDALQKRLSAHRFAKFELIKGVFSATLPSKVEFLREHVPIFVSIDCDFYSSTMDVFEALIPTGIAPHGCMFYFDDVSINFGSDKTGEMRAIREVNEGRFGQHICFVEHPLYIETGEIRHYHKLWHLFDLNAAEKAAAARPTDHKLQVVTEHRISPL